jgi:hypothetical protein
MFRFGRRLRRPAEGQKKKELPKAAPFHTSVERLPHSAALFTNAAALIPP